MPKWCFTRERRSSSTAMTGTPSRSRTAAASWVALNPRTWTGMAGGHGNRVRRAPPVWRSGLAGRAAAAALEPPAAAGPAAIGGVLDGLHLVHGEGLGEGVARLPADRSEEHTSELQSRL